MAGTQTDNLLLLDLTTGLARTSETGGTPDIIQSSVDWQLISGANLLVDGNLTVNGTTTTIHSEQVNIRDNHLYLNADYTTTIAQTGGLVINVLPTATADTIAGTFVAGVAAVSNPTVQTVGSATFAVGDIIQIAGANNQTNDNIYEVLSHVGTTLTIRGIGVTGATVPWVVNDFATDATAGGDVRIVNVNVLQGDSSGNWSTATTTTTTGITYNNFTTQGLVDLQVAYEAGNTITTSVGEGNITFAGTETFAITTTGGVNLDAPFDFDSTSFDVQMTGSNGFSIDGTAASNVSVTAGDLDLSTITSGAVNVTSAGLVDINAATSMALSTDNAANASTNTITLTGGSSTAGTADGASIVLAPGDGFTTGSAGLVNILSPATELEPLLQLAATGTNGETVQMFAGSSNPDTLVTAPAGSLFMRDTGAGGEVYVNNSAGTGTSWTLLSTAAGTTLQTAYEAGNTITTSGAEGNVTINGTEDLVVGGSVTVSFDTTDAILLDADVASHFLVDSAALSLGTTTSGAVDITSAGLLDLDSVGALSLNSSTGALALGNDANTGAINIGTGAAARTITMGNATGATAVNFDSGTGGYTFDSTVDEDVALMTLTTTGTNGDSVNLFVGDSDPSGSVSGLAGSLFFRDTGTGAELYLNNSTGSGTTWVALSTGGSVTLQNAYINGNTITTSGAEGDVTFTGTEDFVVTLSDMLVDTTASISLDADAASNFTVDTGGLTLSTTTSGTLLVDAVALLDVNAGAGMDVDVTGTFDVLSTGAFSIDGTGASNVTATSGDLVLSTLTTGSVLVDGVDGVEINSSAGALNLGNDANTGAINIGTGAAARTLTLGNSTGATGAVLNVGTGEFAVNSTVGEVDPVVTWTTTGANGDSVEMFVGDSDPDTVVTGLAGSLFMRDTGTSGELYINNSTGSGTSWDQVVTVDGGNLTLQQAYIGGNTIVTSAPEGAFDVSGTEAISLDASAASNFSVAGAALTLETTGSGTIDINSAADITVTFATANATALVIDDGTNTYLTFDSTVAEPAVAVGQFLDIVGSGAGVTLTAGEALTAGAVVTIEGTTGDVILADSNTGTTLDGLAIGVAAFAAADTAPVKVYTVPGSLIPVNFAAAPAAALNGRPVFVSQTPGEGTTTAPTGSGNVVYIVGILQGADGADTSPLVMYQPQFIAVRP